MERLKAVFLLSTVHTSASQGYHCQVLCLDSLVFEHRDLVGTETRWPLLCKINTFVQSEGTFYVAFVDQESHLTF